MQPDYSPFIERVIDRYEGGYGWDRNDPGGPTKFGITCYDLAEHRHQRMGSMAEWAEPVRQMQRSEAEDIYRTKYAVQLDFDALPPGIDCSFLDYGINSGVERPIRSARVLLKLPRDPKPTSLAPDLLAALRNTDPLKFVENMAAERIHFMKQIRGGSAWAEYGRGWGARVEDVFTYSEGLIKKVPVPTPAPLDKHPKASHEDPNLANKTITRTGTGTVAGGGGTLAAGTPWWAVLGITAFAVGCGIAFYYFQKRRLQKANETVTLPLGIKI